MSLSFLYSTCSIQIHQIFKISKFHTKLSGMADWDDSVTKGPDTCTLKCPKAAGKRKSPIDISPNHACEVMLPELQTKYNTEKIKQKLQNVGYCWKVVTEGKYNDLALWGGPLQEQHELKYQGEIHFVHINNRYCSVDKALRHSDGLCVLGVFFNLGCKANPEIAKIIDVMNKCEAKGAEAKLERNVDISQIIPFSGSYYTYSGSLTTPPCSECTTWIVFEDPIQISQDQLDAFNSLKDGTGKIITNNFRPLMPLEGREVRLVRNSNH
ncbi:unnamed protein product [Callosobruchus maculatus]|uniref:Alpha-carbonic anhydrase domain-containing protein n=1 Tax=Callosobruchus maculatus TaxID=64391 RepID=A0A653C7Q2_CALMS|nr:unnamed protein product [Callosobruchus maculatus]